MAFCVPCTVVTYLYVVYVQLTLQIKGSEDTAAAAEKNQNAIIIATLKKLVKIT